VGRVCDLPCALLGAGHRRRLHMIPPAVNIGMARKKGGTWRCDRLSEPGSWLPQPRGTAMATCCRRRMAGRGWGVWCSARRGG